MPNHPSMFDYLKPTDKQLEQMDRLREAAKVYGDLLEKVLPDGDDKRYCIRLHRTTAMWVNVVVTRKDDGTPRV
jgi:hypothetical protein